MFTTIIILSIIVAALLILVVLIQNPKGGGLSQFTGTGSQQLFGVKKTGDLLEQITWGFGGAIAVLALASVFFLNTQSSGTNTLDDGLGDVAPAATSPLPKPVSPTPTTPAQPATPAKK
ncbi:MAG: preprotein translocase subunit SecG [Siphonobacter sp.]